MNLLVTRLSYWLEELKAVLIKFQKLYNEFGGNMHIILNTLFYKIKKFAKNLYYNLTQF